MSEVLPVFQTNRLILKAVTLEDAPAYHKNFVDYEVIRHLSAAVPWPYPENGTYDFIKNKILPTQGKDHWVWGIFLKENPNEIIGAVDLWRECRPENRGFWLARRFWRQGIMTEALEPIMTYAFSELGFEKVIVANAKGNIASRRVKEKTGARFLRVEPFKCVDPIYTEHEVWEMTKQDWLSREGQ